MKNKREPGHDRLHKIIPLLNAISAKFDKCAKPEIFVLVDEHIILFKGRHNLKLYDMMEKERNGVIRYASRQDNNGYMHRFQFAGYNIIR